MQLAASTTYGQCLDHCDGINPRLFPSVDAYGVAYGQCLHACAAGENYDIPFPTTTLPPGTQVTSDLPGELAPPPGYEPQHKINWWRLGIAAGLGLAGLAAFVAIRKGVGHGA